MQSIWFTFFIFHRLTNTNPGRLNQYLYPYYQKDLEKGQITNELAQELIDCFWLKLAERWLECARAHLGIGEGIMLGGQTPDGKDATNEITYMCLNAQNRFRLPTPKISRFVSTGTHPRSCGMKL